MGWMIQVIDIHTVQYYTCILLYRLIDCVEWFVLAQCEDNNR